MEGLFVRTISKIQISTNSLVATDYANMDAEELGSVYEALLELVPAITTTPWQFSFIGLDESNTTAGNLRKLTGSYYTPDVLVQSLIDTALKPVIRERLADNPDEPRQALLDLRVVDPACGSGHFLLAATRTLAQSLAPRIRVNAIGPGPVLQSIHQTSAEFAQEIESTLLKRAPDAGEIAAAVKFILASPTLTGQMIALDSGQHLAWTPGQPAPLAKPGSDSAK